MSVYNYIFIIVLHEKMTSWPLANRLAFSESKMAAAHDQIQTTS